MKKGTPVKFIGNETRHAIEKTFVWDVAKISLTENMYLIEHPEGTLLNENTLKDFKGYNTDKLHFGKKYLAAKIDELIDLSEHPEGESIKNNIEMITTTLPKTYFEKIKDLVSTQKEQCVNNKTMIKIAQGMSEKDFNEMVEYFNELIKATDNALKQPQNV